MLPSANGTTLSNTWAPGIEITLTESWNFANVYIRLKLLWWHSFRDNATGMVYQAAYSAPYPVYLNDVLNVSSNLAGSNNRYLCDGNTSPLVYRQEYRRRSTQQSDHQLLSERRRPGAIQLVGKSAFRRT